MKKFILKINFIYKYDIINFLLCHQTTPNTCKLTQLPLYLLTNSQNQKESESFFDPISNQFRLITIKPKLHRFMRFKTLLLSLVACCSSALSFAATDSTSLESSSTKAKALNVKLFLRGDYRGDFYDGSSTSRFTMKPAMVDVYGQFNPMFGYYFRQRFDTPFTIQSDGIPASTLMAYVQITPVKGLNIRLGKQAIAYGSWEFDYNPMDVYFYSKVGSMTQGFSTGAYAGYTIGTQSFAYQVTKTLDDAYIVPGYKSAFNNTFQWGGNFFDGAFKTLWSYTLINADKGKFLHQYMLGNQINIGRVSVDLDYMQLSRFSDYEYNDSKRIKTTDRSYLANVKWLLPKNRVTLQLKCVYDESRAFGRCVNEQITTSTVCEYNLFPQYGLSLHAAYAYRINNTPEEFASAFQTKNENMIVTGFSWNFKAL